MACLTALLQEDAAEELMETRNTNKKHMTINDEKILYFGNIKLIPYSNNDFLCLKHSEYDQGRCDDT